MLLKNDRETLPLAKSLKSLAVIGPDATEARLGGYSGPGVRKVSILDGIRRKLGTSANVRHAPGPGRSIRDLVVIPSEALGKGLAAEYFDNIRLEGTPRITRTDTRPDFRWTLNSPGRGIPFDWYSARWTGTVTSPRTGVTRIGASSDAAVILAGIEEGEFRDRAFLGLPGRQAELIASAAATGKPIVVVLTGGSAVTMSPWLDGVRAVVHAWYPGEAGGDAVADVLFGDENPAGRLPITFPMTEGQLPLHYNHRPTGRGDDYLDLTGMALFPFGFGLSYTTFEYADLQITPRDMTATGSIDVQCTIRNTGKRAGSEVAQHLRICDVRQFWESVGRKVPDVRPVKRTEYGGQEFVVTDPDGHVIKLGECTVNAGR